MTSHDRLRRLGMTIALVGLSANVLGGAALVLASSVSQASPVSTTASATDDTWGAPTSSAITQQWAEPNLIGDRDPDAASYEDLKDISVTVSQTKELTGQGVTVTWTGANPTPTGQFSHSFFQIMQCWGDEATGPGPEQCMWGAPPTALASMLGERIPKRSLVLNEDPAQPYTSEYLIPPPRTQPNLKAYMVPFTTVDGTTVTVVDDYFTPATSNELAAVRTSADGTGAAVFTLQTSMEAPHLGCGATTSSGKPRSCWLVVVPRATVTADGTPVGDLTNGMMTGSPLTATNWADRLVFPMEFQAIGNSCAIGNAERRLVGHEQFTEAMTSWQSGLCATGTTYGWSQIGDDEARMQLVSSVTGAARLAIITKPISEARKGTEVLRYAPIARSALVFGYNIERNYITNAERPELTGTMVDQLTLNPRLIAKLLTQSYRADVPGGGSTEPVKSNPYSIVTDPEFVGLNPEFADFLSSAAPEGLLVALGSSDANAQVWDWLKADKDARSFLAGGSDGHGMKINPAYLALNLDTEETTSFPKADLTTFRFDDSVPEPGFGTLDLRPYMTDMQEGAKRAQRAESGLKIIWDPFKSPPAFVSGGAQLPGQRFQITLTDRTSAERYGLRTARLVNQAGAAVAPSDTAIEAGISTFSASSEDASVKVYDPSAKSASAYPLSTLSYTAVNVCRATATERKDFAAFLDYAAGSGQSLGHAKGQLPPGYLPLTSSDKNELTSLSGLLRSSSQVARLCPVAQDPKKDESPAKPKTKGKKTTAKPEPEPTEEPPTTPPATPPATVPAPAEADEPIEDTPAEEEPAPEAAPQPVEAVVEEAAEPITTAAVSTRGWKIGAIGALTLGIPSSLVGPLLIRRARGLPI